MKCVLVCVAVAVLAAIAANAQDVTLLTEGVLSNYSIKSGEVKLYQLVTAKKARYNIRLTRTGKAFDSSASNVTLEIFGNGFNASHWYNIYFDGDENEMFMVNVTDGDESCSYVLRYCEGTCPAECVKDCSGTGACLDNGTCTCDYMFENDDCSMWTPLKDIMDYLVWIIIGSIVALIVLALLPVIICCCCGVACCCCAAAGAGATANRGTVASQPLLGSQGTVYVAA